jgi:hypothetical protein
VPAALQCPDCGHQEMLDDLGAGVTTFRCGGCGRALKVPAQFRKDPKARGAAPAPRPSGAGEPTQATPRVPPVVTPGVVPPVAAMAPDLPSVPSPAPPLVGAGAAASMPTTRSPMVDAGGAVDLSGTRGPGEPPGPSTPTPSPVPAWVPAAPGSLKPPLILRLALWVIALPLGSLFVFGIANRLKLLTRLQLENTFVLTGWGRFVPIARLLPFCALVTALLLQLGVFGLEWRRARMLRNGPTGRGRPRRGPGGGGGGRPGPTRPLSPNGQGQRATNGGRARDRAIS